MPDIPTTFPQDHRQSGVHHQPMHQHDAHRQPGHAQREIVTRSLGDPQRLLDVALVVAAPTSSITPVLPSNALVDQFFSDSSR
jgi:hypothetical protein